MNIYTYFGFMLSDLLHAKLVRLPSFSDSPNCSYLYLLHLIRNLLVYVAAA